MKELECILVFQKTVKKIYSTLSLQGGSSHKKSSLSIYSTVPFCVMFGLLSLTAFCFQTLVVVQSNVGQVHMPVGLKCMCECKCMCMSVHTCQHTCVSMCKPMCTYVYGYVYECECVNVGVYTGMCVHPQACVHVHTQGLLKEAGQVRPA